MLDIVEMDITEVTKGTIAHQVNCQGVMGAGLAKQIKFKWPKVFLDYQDKCSRATNRGEDPMGHVQYVQIDPGLLVANCFAQRYYGYAPGGGIQKHTSYGALAMCLEELAHPGIQQPVYIPFGIGCGLGGGDWTKVSALIEMLCPKVIICKLPEVS
jgi:O-acetyl-ADP-ribose deacetylase (regulator of RNase III)